MTVGRVKGGRYFVGNFKCARNYARAKRVGASSYFRIFTPRTKVKYEVKSSNSRSDL